MCVHTEETQAVLGYTVIATALDLESCFCAEEVSTVIVSLLFPLRAFAYNQAYFADWWEAGHKSHLREDASHFKLQQSLFVYSLLTHLESRRTVQTVQPWDKRTNDVPAMQSTALKHPKYLY